VRRSSVADDLHCAEIGARLPGRERERGLQSFHIGGAPRLPAARAGVVALMRGGDLVVERADRFGGALIAIAARLNAAMGGSRVDCMTPQKAIRTVFFN
jgi:hypothetical protein